MGLFISTEELQELTGFKKKSLQIQQLQRSGIPFEVNRLGAPIVLQDSVRQVLSGSNLRNYGSKSIDLEALSRIGAR